MTARFGGEDRDLRVLQPAVRRIRRGLMICTEAISSPNRKRVTSTSCTSESLTIIAESKLGGTAGCGVRSASPAAGRVRHRRSAASAVGTPDRTAHEADLDQRLPSLPPAHHLEEAATSWSTAFAHRPACCADRPAAASRASARVAAVPRRCRVGDGVQRVGDGPAPGTEAATCSAFSVM